MVVSKTIIDKGVNSDLYISIIKKASLSLIFAILTGASSRLKLFLPFTPVPVTGQVFMVLLSGIILGAGFGTLSQMLYVFLGISGIPWFALGSLFGPTGGYLIGFIIAPFVISSIARKNTFFIPVALISGVIIIYLFGALQFSLIMKTGLLRTMELAVLPFIPFDILKSELILLIIPYYERLEKYIKI